MTRAFVVRMLAVIGGLLACVMTAHAELTPYLSYTVPGLTNPIQQIDLADVDGDGIAEVLAFDGERFILYSPETDSVLRSFPLDSIVAPLIPDECDPYIPPAVGLLADINHDSLLDAVFLLDMPYDYCIMTEFPERRYLVILVDEVASGSAPTMALDFHCQSRLGIGMFDAVDIDGDGYDNLIVSVDSSEYSEGYMFWYSDYSYGKTLVYYSFPDSLVLESAGEFQNCQNVISSAPRTSVATAVFSSWEDPPTLGPWDVRGSHLHLLDSTCRTISVTAMPDDYFCQSMHDYIFRDYLNSVLVADLDGNPAESEVLATYDWSHACDTYYFDPADSSGRLLKMFRFVEPDSLAELWSVELGTENFTGFITDSSYPGQFLAIVDGALTRFDATDGSVVRRYDPLPSGSKSWVYPYGDGVPYLMVVSDQTVTYYTFDEVTDVETGAPSTLPTTFTLGQPYPNPFNPLVTIPLVVDHKGHLRVDVFNPLGQRVATLHDAAVSPGETTLSWDASDFGSGVYLIKATLGEITQSVKAVLVK